MGCVCTLGGKKQVRAWEGEGGKEKRKKRQFGETGVPPPPRSHGDRAASLWELSLGSQAPQQLPPWGAASGLLWRHPENSLLLNVLTD